MWKLSLLCLCMWSIVAAQDESSGGEGVKASSASLIFNGESVVVNPGQRLQLDCGVEGEYRSCFWENKDGEKQQTLQLEDVKGGFLKGFSQPAERKGNECGIVINSVNAREHHGEWTCKVFVVAKTLQGTKRVVVTVKPQSPSLDINENPLVVAEGEEKEVSCAVAAARPPAIIRWFVGTEDVTAKSDSENTPTDDKGTYRSVSSLKYKFHYTEDRKSLRCSIEHTTLQEPEFAEVPLDIRFAPYPISTTRIYGIPMESEYEIKYNFTSNPVPKMSWHINDDLQIPVPGESGRYLTSIRNLMDNIYMATLRIRDFSSEDVNVLYRLHAMNELGEKNFDITLSTGPAPPDTIGNGTIAAIIVIVVFILILLFIIGMMRYRQMYCFAMRAESKAYIQDPERRQSDYANFKINEAIKGSMDQLNGRTAPPESFNGNGAGMTTATVNIEPQQVQHHHNHRNTIETVAHHHQYPIQHQEKKNTDV